MHRTLYRTDASPMNQAYGDNAPGLTRLEVVGHQGLEVSRMKVVQVEGAVDGDDHGVVGLDGAVFVAIVVAAAAAHNSVTVWRAMPRSTPSSLHSSSSSSA